MRKHITLLSFLFSPSILAELPSDVHISVFSTNAYTIQNQALAHTVYQLDGVEQWENQISQTLSVNPTQAEQQAKALLQTTEAQNQLKALQQRYQGVIYGWQQGIRKVPAILFESPQFGKAVVYGEVDVQRAMTYWERWIGQQKQGE